MPSGRPTLYSEEIGREICLRLAEGESLRAVCAGENMPHESTVRSWAIDPDHPISTHYRAARELGYHKMADELLEISDDGTNDWMVREGKDGESTAYHANGEHVQRSKLRVETRKWLLAKALPKIYGDRISAEVTGKDGKDLVPESASTRDLARVIMDIFRTASVTPEAED